MDGKLSPHRDYLEALISRFRDHYGKAREDAVWFMRETEQKLRDRAAKKAMGKA